MLTFPNVSPAAFALVLDQLRKEGSTVRRTDTAISGDGVQDRYRVEGEHFPLGKISADVKYEGTTVYVDVVKPKEWEHAIGAKLQDAISDAKRKISEQQSA